MVPPNFYNSGFNQMPGTNYNCGYPINVSQQSSSNNVWAQQSFYQPQQPQQQSGFSEMMPMMMQYAQATGDTDILKQMMPLMMMSSMGSSGGSMMSMMPMLMMMQGTDMSSMFSDTSNTYQRTQTINGENGCHDKNTIEGYARNAGEEFEALTLSDNFLSGKPLGETEVKFVQNREEMSKQEFGESLKGLAQVELNGCDLNQDGQVTTTEYTEVKYNQVMERYKALYNKGQISAQQFNAMQQSLKDKIMTQAETMDFAYNEHGNATNQRDGILQLQDVQAMYGQLDSMGTNSYDGKFTSSEAAGLSSASSGDNSHRIRQNLFSQHQELFEPTKKSDE